MSIRRSSSRWVVLSGLTAAAALMQGAGPVRAQRRVATPAVRQAVQSAVSPALSSLPPVAPGQTGTGTVHEIPIRPLVKRADATRPLPSAPVADPVLQAIRPADPMPDPLVNFEGIGQTNGVLPPDTDGDAGPNHYVQWVNLSLAVYDKTGNLLAGPVNGNTLWSGLGPPCETHNDGDIIVKYDRAADRWFLSQFALTTSPTFGPFYQCIAVSQTGDPTGAYYLYAFKISDSKLNDYPKFGIWPDGYYMTFIQFNQSTYGGQGVAAFERDKMLVGDPGAQMVIFDLFAFDPNLGGMLPSDFDGPPPLDGTPNTYIEVDFPEGYPTTDDILNVFEFHVDWNDPASSTFAGPLVLKTDPFSAALCGFAATCIKQPGTSQLLEALSDRLMYRLQYRNFGDHESLVMNHTVDVGNNRAGIRWYELRRDVDDWAIFQQGTYTADDDASRWMGSIAQDRDGNIALGFSVSGPSTFPAIRYVGRLSGDPPGTMTQSETSLIEGGGVQTHSSGRWGDYSAMAIDPVDDCSFWYTQEYYGSTSVANWQTRVGSFQFPSCSQTLLNAARAAGSAR